jgi:eukaryotic-like serine/threonine-protein kinase
MEPTLPVSPTAGDAGVVGGSTGEDGRATPPLIPDHRLLEVIGEGGFGWVWEAEQLHPVRRRVALKVIKPGMDSKAVLARFDAERQALAMMNHPNVASVYNAGQTERERPWFSMELVRGLAITAYADEKRLDLRSRIELMIPVCEAVQHAHHKGVVHRDIKPSNILVVERDGKPVPKVIDFGIAKAVHAPLTDRTMHTVQGQMMGTPAYMSPEQASGLGLDVDTRTDVYSLGAVLYVLLTGELPFDPEESVSRTRDRTPSRPSHKLAQQRRTRSDTVAATTIADGQPGTVFGVSYAQLSKRLRGDLDWIVLKALAFERERRYATAADLAGDLRRHLEGRPVLATPPSLRYRTGKFVARHKTGVIAAALVLLGLIGGVAGLAYGFVQQRARADEVSAALEESRTARNEAQAVVDFLVEMLVATDPSQSLGREVTVRELLDRSRRGIPARFEAQPAVAARLHEVMGSSYGALGEYQAAADELRDAIALRAERLGDEHPSLAPPLRQLGEVLMNAADFAESEAAFARAKVIEETHGIGPVSDDGAWDDSEAMLLYFTGRYEDAEAQVAEVLDDLNPSSRADALVVLAAVCETTNREERAITLYREALDLRQSSADVNPVDLASLWNNLANAYEGNGQFSAAEAAHRNALRIRRELLPPNHPHVATTLNNLGLVLTRTDRPDQAETMLREALAMREAQEPRSEYHIGIVLNNLGGALSAQGRHEDALAVLERAVESARLAVGEEHVLTLTLDGNRAAEVGKVGNHAVAVAELEAVYRRMLALEGVGAAHRRARRVAELLAQTYEAWTDAQPGVAPRGEAERWARLASEDER